jgi:hypothetical protein
MIIHAELRQLEIVFFRKLFHGVDGLLGKGESSDKGANTLVGFTCWNVTSPYWSGNPAIFVAHTVNAISPVCLGQMEIANIGGKSLIGSSVGGLWHLKDAINGFHAGLKDFFGYTVHVIIGFLVLG